VRFLVAALAFLTAVCLSVADEGQHHHDELNQQQLGSVHFPVSCDAQVQKAFERGVALLHSFAFESAESTFRQIAQDDPHCAMAHWGIAMTFSRWGEPTSDQLKHGWEQIRIAKSLRPKTPRERDYVAAETTFYRHPEKKDKKRDERRLKALQKIYQSYPDDHEGAAWYAFALMNSDRADDPAHAARKQAAAILERLFVIEPNHPGIAHYLIHTYDYPGMGESGLAAAQRYAQIAPAAPHALHMPSHIFARLGMWDDDIASNLASIAASRNSATTHMGDEGHQYHAMEFLIYAYLQSGRDAEAQRLIEDVKALPQMKSMYGNDLDPRIFALVAYQASYVLESHQWEQAVALPLIPGTELGDDSVTYLARAIGAAQLGRAEEARQYVVKIRELHEQVVAKKLSYADWVDNLRKDAEAWADHAEGKNEDAIKLLRERAAEEKDGMFAAQGSLPPHEMLADVLAEMNRSKEALVEYEAELKLNPNRFNSLYGAGRAAEAAKQPQKAAAYYQQLTKLCSKDSKRSELAYARQFLSTVARN
jgi:predicted Zn-dependent protease